MNNNSTNSELKLIKSDVIISNKNFVGFSDEDYKLVNCLNSNNVDSAIKNNLFVKSSVHIGNINNLNTNKIFNNNLLLNVDGESKFNNNISINNSLKLESEIIETNFVNNNFISLDTYKKLLANILDSVTNNKNSYSSIQFIPNINFNNNSLIQSIFSVSKIFIITENNIKINCNLLVYALIVNNKIITCRPILDTFIILDDKYNIIKIINDE